MNASPPIEPFYGDRSESIANSNDTPLVVQNFVPFHANEDPTRERDSSCLQRLKNRRQSVTITRESHSPHFCREKRAASTAKLQHVPSIFFLLGHEIRCFCKDETQRKTRRKFTRATVFRRDHGGGFSFRDPREILALEVWRSTAPLLYLEIKSSKIRLFLQTRDLMYLAQNQDTSKSQ